MLRMFPFVIHKTLFVIILNLFLLPSSTYSNPYPEQVKQMLSQIDSLKTELFNVITSIHENEGRHLSELTNCLNSKQPEPKILTKERRIKLKVRDP